MAISMPDAVLIANKERAQDVKKAVTLLKSKNIAQAEIFPKTIVHSWFESLALGERFLAKCICKACSCAESAKSQPSIRALDCCRGYCKSYD